MLILIPNVYLQITEINCAVKASMGIFLNRKSKKIAMVSHRVTESNQES